MRVVVVTAALTPVLAVVLTGALTGLALVSGCPAADGEALGVEDAGFCAPDAGVDVVPDPAAPDAGFCGELLSPDSGAPNPSNDAEICLALVTRSCGAEDECQEDPGCVAATLTSQFTPADCADGLGDNQSFPPCTAGACDRLVIKVCGTVATGGEGEGEGEGEGGACDDAPACGPSRVLQDRSDDGDVSAETSCGSALSDEALFPRCGAA